MGTQAGGNAYGAALRAAMSRHDPPMGLSELSRSAGLTRQAIRDILDGKTQRPNIGTVGKIERVLGDWTAPLSRPSGGIAPASSGGLSDQSASVPVEVLERGPGTHSGAGVVTVRGAAIGVEVTVTFNGPEERRAAIADAMAEIREAGASSGGSGSGPAAGDGSPADGPA